MLTCGSRSEGGHAYGRASARDRERETKSSLGSDRVVVVGLLEGVEEEQEEEGGELRAMPAQRSAAAARRRASFTSAKCTSTCFSPPTEELKKEKEKKSVSQSPPQFMAVPLSIARSLYSLSLLSSLCNLRTSLGEVSEFRPQWSTG